MISKEQALIIIILLSFLILRFYSVFNTAEVYKDAQYLSFETTLIQEPKIVGRYQMFSANSLSGEKILIKTSRFPEFHYGDSLRISGILSKRMLTNKQVVLAMSFPKTEVIKNDKNLLYSSFKSLLAITSSVRQKIIFSFQKTLPPTSSSLLLGIVFGIKEQMPQKFTEDLRISGVMHVVAASGMNVSMAAGFLTAVFSVLFKRQIALIASILGICFYAFLAGLEPSIIRASIMGILAFSAQILGRQRLAFFSLCLAGYIMLFTSPNLISDIGFQLSFISTLGLLYIKPLFNTKKRIMTDDLTTTISAQAATLPILLSNFGAYSLWSILVNGILLWTIPLLMIFGGLAAIFGLIFEPFGQVFLYLSLPFLIYFEKVVGIFSQKGGIINLQNFPWQLTAGYYSLLIAFILFFKKR